jgi:hypothetical protein
MNVLRHATPTEQPIIIGAAHASFRVTMFPGLWQACRLALLIELAELAKEPTDNT